MPVPGAHRAALLLAVAWLAYFTALQWSVVRFKVPIVLALTACAVGLAVWQVRRPAVRLTPPGVALMLVGSAVVTLLVPLYSYLDPAGLLLARGLLAGSAIGAAVLLWRPSAGRAGAALGLAVIGYLAAGVTAILRDPAPRIDVWVALQQAADALARGVSFYEVTWTGSPGVEDAFTYLPWTAVLLAPGRWLGGDVRWALLAWTLVAVVGVWWLARPVMGTGHAHRPAGGAAPAGGGQPGTEGRTTDQGWQWRAAGAASLVLLAPGTLTQVDQAWTEPLLLAGLVWWAVLVHRGHAWWAVVPLALACASKQHLALLLPVLLLWRPFGARRTLATGALAAVLVAPWFLAGPAEFLQDTVILLVSFHAILFANTWYLLALNVFGVELPFWLTGLVVLGCLAAVAAVVHRRQPGLAEVLRWLALLLLMANLVNKQAFYNQYWLSGTLVVVSLALAQDRQRTTSALTPVPAVTPPS